MTPKVLYAYGNYEKITLNCKGLNAFYSRWPMYKV